MKKITTLCFLIACTQLAISQSVNVKFNSIENIYEISSKTETNDKIKILVLDDKNPNIFVSFLFNKDASESTFVEKTLETIKNHTKEYHYQIHEGAVLKILNKNLNYDNFEMVKPTAQVLQHLLKPKSIFKNGDYAASINASFEDDTIETLMAFPDNQDFIFLKDSVNITFKAVKDSISFTANNEETFFRKIDSIYSEIQTNLKPVIISNNEFIKFTNSLITLNESSKSKLSELYNALKEDREYTFINNVVLKDLSALVTPIDKTNQIYNISIKNNHKEKYYKLKFCDEDYNCKQTIKILYRTEKVTFNTIINKFIKSLNENFNDLTESQITELYLQVKRHNEQSIIADASKPFKEEIKSLIDQIESLETRHSAVLKLNKEVRVYRDTKNKQEKDKHGNRMVAKDTTFIAEYATVRFFNSKAKEVVVVGKLSPGDKEFTVTNFQYSISLRSFRNSLNYVPISPNDDDSDLFLNYNDLFEYYPKDATSNYSARNKEYRIKADSTVKIEERKLMDYFTAVVFSDFLGLNDQNANSLLQAEGRIKVPLWIFNKQYFSAFPAINADLNATIYNGFDDNSRFITPIDVEVADNNLNSVTINVFDYIKYNNLNTGISLDVANIELKGLSTEWSFGYGLRYYRAGLKYTSVNNGLDEIKRYQLNALSHELITNFEVRPQLNFGADLNFAFNWLNGRGSVDNLDILFNEENGNDKKEVLRVQLNLYSKINPDESNGGIYARLGGFYHFGSKDFYPQILVGYATNLSSFVNKFSKK